MLFSADYVALSRAQTLQSFGSVHRIDEQGSKVAEETFSKFILKKHSDFTFTIYFMTIFNKYVDAVMYAVCIIIVLNF